MTIRKLPAAPDVAGVAARFRSEVPEAIYARFNGNVKAAADDENSISIFGTIGQDFWDEGVTAKRIDAALRRIGSGNPVTVNINSPGGDVFEGLAIYSQLREHSGKVTVKVMGLAASAASIIAMAGDDVQVSRAGFLMIHNTWVVAMGNRHDLREAADTLEPFDSALADIYAARTGIAEAEIAAMLDKETWIGGAEAVEKGFADGLLSSDEVKEEKGASASALRRLDNALAEGKKLPRAERRQLIKELAAMPSASAEGTPRAAEGEAEEGLDYLRLAAARLSLLRA